MPPDDFYLPAKLGSWPLHSQQDRAMRCDLELSDNYSAHLWNILLTEIGVCGSCLLITDEINTRYNEQETGTLNTD